MSNFLKIGYIVFNMDNIIDFSKSIKDKDKIIVTNCNGDFTEITLENEEMRNKIFDQMSLFVQAPI